MPDVASGPEEPWRKSEREVEAEAAVEPRDPITQAETIETEIMEELTEEEQAEQEARERRGH